MENSNERVAEDAERGADQNQTEPEIKLTAEEALQKMQSAFQENREYRKKVAERGKVIEDLQSRLKDLEAQTAKEKGNYKDLYSKTAQELDDERNKFKQTVSNYAKRVIHGTVKEKLLESKCSRPDAILKLMQEKILDLQIDDEFNPDETGVKFIVEESLKEYPEWFKSETPKINDATPAGKLPKKPLSEMTKDEIEAALAALDK